MLYFTRDNPTSQIHHFNSTPSGVTHLSNIEQGTLAPSYTPSRTYRIQQILIIILSTKATQKFIKKSAITFYHNKLKKELGNIIASAMSNIAARPKRFVKSPPDMKTLPSNPKIEKAKAEEGLGYLDRKLGAYKQRQQQQQMRG